MRSEKAEEKDKKEEVSGFRAEHAKFAYLPAFLGGLS